MSASPFGSRPGARRLLGHCEEPLEASQSAYLSDNYRCVMTYREFFSHVVDVVEAVGATILVVGGLIAFARFVLEVAGHRGRDSYGDLRKNLGRVILLGLEVL